MSIEARNITKTFGGFKALDDVSLHVRTGELVALLGPSGSGKTSLLRIIAGLETPDPGGGSVLFNDEDVSGRDVGRRRVGFVFQHYALFRHMTVANNVAFGLSVRPWRERPSKKVIRERVRELLQLVQLDTMANRYPSQLSGGQRQRVALARALAVEPKVLLLDEPFGALDAKVRRELRRWLRKLHDQIHITSVFVTHDQEEALEVADRVAVMSKGRIEQIGTSDEVYEKPANAFVYNFLGNVNLFHGRMHDGRLQVDGGSDGNANTGKPVYVRPHELDVSRDADGSSSAIPARVDHISPVGPIVRLHLERTDTKEIVEAELTRERFQQLKPKQGENVYIHLRNPRLFDHDYSI